MTRADRLCRWIAFRLPRRLVYWCFLRVHGESEPWWPFEDVCRQWEQSATNPFWQSQGPTTALDEKALLALFNACRKGDQ